MACCRRTLVGLMLLFYLTGCGALRPTPTAFNPAEYEPIDFDLLLNESPTLRAGQRVRTQAFFWQFLTYDPAPQYYYFNHLASPFRWGELEWFALYQEATMKGYFDRVAMSAEQRRQFSLNRLEPLMLYGELVPFGGRKLYLLIHHIERYDLD